MGLLIGMDEAGLGPNLGPFVVAATVWEVPSPTSGFDFWTAFEQVLTRSPSSCDPRLHVADSKQVFQPGRGIGSLERGVGSALRLCGVTAATFQDLCTALSCPLSPRLRGERASSLLKNLPTGLAPVESGLCTIQFQLDSEVVQRPASHRGKPGGDFQQAVSSTFAMFLRFESDQTDQVTEASL